MNAALEMPRPSPSASTAPAATQGSLSIRRAANPQVLPRLVDPPCPAHVAAQLLDLVEAPELEARAPARFGLRHAGPDMVGHLPFDVVAQLAVQLSLEPVTAAQPPPAHRAPPPAAPRIRPTASARRSQLSVCSCNRARPLGVSR